MSDRRPHHYPTFSSPDEERTHMKQRMAAAFRLFDRFGFNEGVAGHLTGRDPEHPELFWVNPFGLSFGLIRASDLILVNHEGKVVEGDWPVNTAAFAIHSQIHAARPDVKAAAHTHSPYGRAFSTLGGPGPAHPGRLRLLRRPRRVRRLHRRGPRRRGGQAHRPRAGRQQGRHPAQPRPAHRGHDRRRGGVVVHHHGALVPRAAHGRGRRRPDLHRRRVRPLTAGQVGGEAAGWFSFQPLYDKIVADQPDLLD